MTNNLANIDNILDKVKPLELNFEVLFNTKNFNVVINVFEHSKEYRNKNKVTYSLEYLLSLIFIAKLKVRAVNYCDIANYGKIDKDFFVELGLLKKGQNTPSHDTIRRFFELFDMPYLKLLFTSAINVFFKRLGLITESYDESMLVQLCADGQEIRGSGRSKTTQKPLRNKSNLHIYDTSCGLNIFSETIDEKSNEIPTLQNFIGHIKDKNILITADALHCQYKTCELITSKKKKGEYLISVKSNQHSLYNEIKKIFTNNTKNIDYENYFDFEIVETESRKIFIAHKRDNYGYDWPGFKTFIKAISYDRNPKGTAKYYVSSLNKNDLIVSAIEHRWDVENDYHKFTDVYLEQDKMRGTSEASARNVDALNGIIHSFYMVTKVLLNEPTTKIIQYRFMLKTKETLSLVVSALRNKSNRVITQVENKIKSIKQENW